MSPTPKLRPPFKALAAAALLCLGNLADARADETLKFRLIEHITNIQTQEIGDVDGHLVGVGHYSGLASFPDGSVGTAYFSFVVDYTKGAGPFGPAYHNVTLGDGSVLWFKAGGNATVEGTKSVQQGTLSVLGGKGKFEGAKGDGTLAGVRLTPLAAGADVYYDIVINLKK